MNYGTIIRFFPEMLNLRVVYSQVEYSEIINESPWYPALEFTFLKLSFLLDGVVIKCYH